MTKPAVKKVTVKSTYTMTVTEEDIRLAFGIPPEAEIVFHVPGGGDYSNIELALGDNLTATWEVIETPEENTARVFNVQEGI